MRDPLTLTVLLIAGMRENRCREQVSAALEGVAGVSQVHVSLFRSRATVLHSAGCRPEQLVAVLERIGYHAALQDGEAGPAGIRTLARDTAP